SKLLYDARFALRGFRRTPGFFATAVIILGLGIGMAVAMFTVFRIVSRHATGSRPRRTPSPAQQLLPLLRLVQVFRRMSPSSIPAAPRKLSSTTAN
ncbi:MAG: hypothetical protein ACREOJ_16950, partial [Gemmatimonadaceae bacterium]